MRRARGLRTQGLLLCCVVISTTTSALGLNEPTHQLVNVQAVSVSVLNSVLQEQLGLPQGIRTEVGGKDKTVSYWFGLGGAREDEGAWFEYVTGKARPFRHFHDPLRPWDRSGLFFPLTIPPRFTRFESSIRWVQRMDQDRETGHGGYAWPDARRYFLTALTAPDPKLREQAFANTFRALGQIMHLLTDASVPEHVRNDAHPMGAALDRFGQVGNYEYWVLAQHRKAGTEPQFIREFLSAPITLDPALLEIPIPASESIARVPIARLFDSDRYTGNNPEVAAESRIGIAETANAHFVSEDAGPEQYPHPALADMDKYVGSYSKLGEKRAYYKMKSTFRGLSVNPVAAECALNDLTGFDTLCVDDDVWRETARHMLPRAVRYGQEVLDYFFRGKLEVRREPDPTTGQPSLRIVNRSPEPLGEGGVLTLYQDNDQGERSPVQGATLSLSDAVPKNNEAAPLHLPIPVDLPDEGLTLVYQGPLGGEADAVMGKRLNPIRVEHVYRDWWTEAWILRTAHGLYVLPLETVAGLTTPLDRVTWGDRDNQLVAITDPAGADPYQALLFELDRPLGSAAVPLSGKVTEDGYPLVALRLLQRVPLYEVFGALDLNTTVEFSGRLEFMQYMPSYTVRTTCVDIDPEEKIDLYSCTSATGDDAVGPAVKTWNGTGNARFPLRLDPLNHVEVNWDPPHFGWFLGEVRADRAGRLTAVVRIAGGSLPKESWPELPTLVEVNSGGGLEETSRVAGFDGDFFFLDFWVAVVVDLSSRRLVAKSSTDQISIHQTHRVVEPSGYWWSPIATHNVLVYRGGTRNGERFEWWEPRYTGISLGSDPPTRVGLTIPDRREMRLDSAAGGLRESLAALGVGGLTSPDPPADCFKEVGYRTDPDETVVLLRVPCEVSQPLTAIGWPSWMRWTGPIPGKLRVHVGAEPGYYGDQVGGWLVDWSLEGDTARLTYSEISDELHYPLTGNASGVLASRWSAGTWLWIPWLGAAQELPGMEDYWPEEFVALDPDYIYGIETGRFHTLLPGLPAEAGPPPLVFGEEDEGEYHVVGR